MDQAANVTIAIGVEIEEQQYRRKLRVWCFNSSSNNGRAGLQAHAEEANYSNARNQVDDAEEAGDLDGVVQKVWR